MKIQGSKQTLVKTNADNAPSMQFGIGDPAMVIEILRKRLYSNPIQTLVQEYISNARDACREASLPTKIQVTVPNTSNAVFKVRDFGCGISPDRIANVFVNYCSSTKRMDNSQTGGFGIGAKSAWAYTDNFTVISYYNGIARTYLAHVGKSNQGSLDLISELATAESNGTEVHIAVSAQDLNAFEQAIYRCTLFWPASERPELTGISQSDVPAWYRETKPAATLGNLQFYNNSHTIGLVNSVTLAIDGIPYAVSSQLRDCVANIPLYDNARCVISVPNGAVEVSASREQLADSAYTQTQLKKIADAAALTIQQSLAAQLNAAADLREFIDAYKYFRAFTDPGAQTFKGYDVNGSLGVNNVACTRFELDAVRNSDKLRLEATDNSSSLFRTHNVQYLYDDNAKGTGKATIYSKVRKHLLSQSDPEGSHVLLFALSELCSKDEFETLIKELRAIPLSSIEVERSAPAEKKPSTLINVTVFGSSSRRRSYHSRGSGSETIQLDLNTLQDTYVYVVKHTDSEAFTRQRHHWQNFAADCEQHFKVKFCFVANTVASKLDGCPQFITAEQFKLEALDRTTAELRERFDRQVRAEITNTAHGLVDNLIKHNDFKTKVTNIEDEFLRDTIQLVAKTDHHYGSSGYHSDLTLYEQVRQQYRDTKPEYKQLADTMDRFVQLCNSKYALISASIEYNRPDQLTEMILYLNTKYERG